MAEKKEFFKITFQDMEIAKEFFENNKHYTEWLFLVSEFYQGNILSSKIKIVQKYFTSYKKTIDYVINSKEEGRKGFEQRIANQRVKDATLDGYINGTSSTVEPMVDANYKLLTINNKLLTINNKTININDKLSTEKILLKKESKGEKINFQEIATIFNTVCHELPKVEKITKQRENLISVRIKEHSLEKIGDVFRLTSESDYLNGKINNWKASFDWIMNPTNFQKILEGNYKNKTNGQSNTTKTDAEHKQSAVDAVNKRFGIQ